MIPTRFVLVAPIAALLACAPPPPPPSDSGDAALADRVETTPGLDASDGTAPPDAPDDTHASPDDAADARGDASCACASGLTCCDGRCVDTVRDLNHCGMCDRACPTRAHAAPTCELGGVCGNTCAAGFADCDGDLTTGCEAELASDANHCGACGARCAAPNSTLACASGACAVAACAPGYADCDGNAMNGCEARLDTRTDCGMCGRRCAIGQVCSALGTCTVGCPPLTATCDGACVSTQTNSRHCGGCGRACAASEVCTAGMCVPAPPPNDRCDGAIDIALPPRTPSFRVDLTLTGATHDLDAPAGCGLTGGDVFFRLVLTRRELVAIDTFGSRTDAELFFAASCTAPLARPTAPGERLCNDEDAACAEAGAARVIAALDPGTYYLVVAGRGSATGALALNVHHVPIGSGAPVMLARGMSTVTSRVGATSTNEGSCGGAGKDASFWWASCPASSGGAFFFQAASPTMLGDPATGPFVAYFRDSVVGERRCVAAFSSFGFSTPRTSVSTVMGSALHVLTLDALNARDPEANVAVIATVP